MIPGEPMLSALSVRTKLAALRDQKCLHANTLSRAIARHGMPCHPNPFGQRGYVFYWSEIETWLANLKPSTEPQRRGPGRPRKSF